MDKLLNFMSRKEPIVFYRLLGVALLIVGIVTAVMDKSFGGFTPIFWFLLAFASFLGVLCNQSYRAIRLLEDKKQK
jgi:Na+/citrate or Na+/malate symporter